MKKKIYGLLIALMIFPSFSFASTPKKATVINPDTGHRKEVFVGSKTAFDGGYVLEVAFGYKELPDDLVGFSAITDYSKFLSQNITAAATTLPVTSMETTDGHTITMADLGSKVFLTIEPQSTLKKELVMCTGISGLSFTGCTRGLAFYGTSTAAVAINAKTHNSGSTVTISNVHYVYEELVDKDSDQELTGDITFSGDVDFANIPTSTTTLPTENNELATKLYVDTVGAGGFSNLNASTTKGLETYGTAPETVGIKASSTGGLEFSSDGALQVKASSTGGISIDNNGIYFDTSDDFTFTGETVFGETTISDLTLTNSPSGVSNNTHVFSGVAGENISAGKAVFVSSGADLSTSQTTGANATNLWGTCAAQTFTALGRYLKSVTVYWNGNSFTGNVTATIMETTGGVPVEYSSIATSTMANRSGAGAITFNFSTYAPLVVGGVYAVAIDGEVVNNTLTWTMNDNGNPYAGGSLYLLASCNETANNWTIAGNDDAYFITSEDYYDNDTAGKIYLSDADAPSAEFANNFIGFAKNSITKDSTGLIVVSGVMPGLSSLTIGSTYYISNTAGSIGTSAGSVSKKVGMAVSATELLIKNDN